MDISQYIYNNDIQGLKSFLDANPGSANAEIALPGQDGPTAHALHRLCDAVFCHMIDEDSAVRMAELLIEAGASVDGNLPAEGRDTPLTAAASLYTDKLGSLYIKHGANLSHKGTYGGTALHWAAWCGRSALVGELLEAIQALPDPDRTVITLYYGQELLLRDISEVLDVTESRVSQIHSRALYRLNRELAMRTEPKG